jgi:hypothetical protein
MSLSIGITVVRDEAIRSGCGATGACIVKIIPGDTSITYSINLVFEHVILFSFTFQKMRILCGKI